MSIGEVKILELFSVHHSGLLYGGCSILVFLNREGAKDAKIYVFLPNRDGRFDNGLMGDVMRLMIYDCRLMIDKQGK